MSLIPWRKHEPERPPVPDFEIGPFEQRGLLLVRFPSNHPLFVAGALALNLEATYKRFHQGPLGGDRANVEEEFRRALEKQNELHHRQTLGRPPSGILAFNNDMPGLITAGLLGGYGYNYREFVEGKGQYATAIGNLIVAAQRRGIGAAIARELLSAGTPYTVDPDRVLHTMHEIDPPARDAAVPVWERPAHVIGGQHYDGTPRPVEPPAEYVKGTIIVIRDLVRAYPDMPEYTVVDGVAQNP